MQFFFAGPIPVIRNFLFSRMPLPLSLFLFLLGIALMYGLLWLAVPRGSLLHELLHLPPFWVHLLSSPGNNFREERIAYGAHRRQYMLLCIPPEGMPLQPAVLFYFHGGGWQFGAPEQFRPQAQQLTRKGFVVLLPSCRRLPRYNYRHIREDLTQMLLKARDVLAQREMGEKKAIIGGMSAGGNMAALAALDHEGLEQAGLSPEWFQGLFLLGAPLHLDKMASSPTLRFFAGPRDQPMFRQASPYQYLNKSVNISTLIIHGAKDGMVKFEGAREFANRMKAVNAAETRFVSLPEGTHLDVASWFFREGEAREAFWGWLERLSG